MAGLRIGDMILLWLGLNLWVATFLLGTRVDSAPYRNGLATFAGGWPGILSNGVVVLLTYTLTNVAILCVLAGVPGTPGSKARLGSDRDQPEDADSSVPRSSAALRAFLVYLFVIAGLLILGDDPASPTQRQYVRLASFISLLGFIVNYRPALFGRLLQRAGALIEEGGKKPEELGARGLALLDNGKGRADGEELHRNIRCRQGSDCKESSEFASTLQEGNDMIITIDHRKAATTILVGLGLAVLTTLTLHAQDTEAEMRRLREHILNQTVAPREALAREGIADRPITRETITAGQAYPVTLDRDYELLATSALRNKIAQLELRGSVIPMPGVIRELGRDGRTDLQLKSFVIPGGLMSYDKDGKQFVGSIRLGIAHIFGGHEGEALSAPVQFEVVEAGLAEPPTVVLNQTSPPLETIGIRAQNPKGPVIVHVVSKYDPTGVAVSLDVAPTLFVSVDRSAIQGYGLETTKVHVWTVGLQNPEGTEVELASNPSAFFDDSKLFLSGAGTAQTELRSDSMGNVVISAMAAGVTPGSADIRFDLPWRTLVFALLGCAIGGLVRVLSNLSEFKKPSRLALAFVTSALAGVLLFSLYAIGVNVFGIEPSVTVGSIAVLALCALGAWFGTAALPKPPEVKGAK